MRSTLRCSPCDKAARVVHNRSKCDRTDHQCSWDRSGRWPPMTVSSTMRRLPHPSLGPDQLSIFDRVAAGVRDFRFWDNVESRRPEAETPSALPSGMIQSGEAGLVYGLRLPLTIPGSMQLDRSSFSTSRAGPPRLASGRPGRSVRRTKPRSLCRLSRARSRRSVAAGRRVLPRRCRWTAWMDRSPLVDAKSLGSFRRWTGSLPPPARAHEARLTARCERIDRSLRTSKIGLRAANRRSRSRLGCHGL